MIPTQTLFNHIIAFEVSKETLVVHVLPIDEQRTIDNTRAAVLRLLCAETARNRKASLGPMLVVCEATGGYERHVLAGAHELALACHKAHGSRVRFFARYLGLGAKTDAIDARMLALYALRTERLRLHEPPSPEEEALRNLKARRDEIQDMIIAETNRLEHAHHRSIRAGLKAHIRTLRTIMAAIDKEIAGLLRTDALGRKARLLQTVIGVGPQTAASCLAYMPELGHLTKGEAAALAGLAPLANDSGKLSAPRHTGHGRSQVRRALYMAALVAIRRNPVIAAFAQRLRKAGKPFKLVITAVMRKLIVILNAILQSNLPWKYANAA
jgi:transposase